jgi:hypothetical protein
MVSAGKMLYLQDVCEEEAAYVSIGMHVPGEHPLHLLLHAVRVVLS